MRTLLAVALFAPLLAQAAVVDRVLIRQQWPWKTEVKVDYRVTGLTEAVDVTPTFYDGDTELPAPGFDANYVGDVKYVFQDGNHSFTFDPKVVFGLADGASLEHLRVKLTLTPTACPANYADKLYRIIDLRSGEITDLYRADFYNRKYGAFETEFSAVKGNGKAPYTTDLDANDVFMWTGVTNDVYRTVKLVLRRIPSADKVWTMGEASGKYTNIEGCLPAHPVLLTEDYWISVFEVTREQYARVMEEAFVTGNITNTWPKNDLAKKEWRGTTVNADPVAAKTFMGRLASMTGLSFDLPTDAQWEYAARAGTTAILPHNSATDLDEIAWGGNKSSPQTVGRLRPNAFGLYDMLGNANEIVRDSHYTFSGDTTTVVTNPCVLVAGKEIDRGGSYSGSVGSNNRYICVPKRTARSSSAVSTACRLSSPMEGETVVAGSVVTSASAPAEVLVNPQVWCPFWHTASNASFTVRWTTPIYGSPAKLTVTGIRGKPSLVYDGLTEGSCMVTWPIEPTDFRSEDMLTLTLDFSDGSSKTATLGLVGGMAAGDESPNGTRFLSDATGIAWSSVPRKAVAVVPPDALALTNGTDEVAVTPGMTWLGLGPLKSGVELPLTLVTDTGTVEQVVFGETLGALLILR